MLTGYRGELLLALVLWPYGAWMTLYFFRLSVLPQRSRRGRARADLPKWVLFTPFVPILLFTFSIPHAFVAHTLEGVAWVLAALVVGFGTRWWASRGRGEVLEQWAQTVPLSYAQRHALGELWKAFRQSRVPKPDPLSALNEMDMEHLLEVSSVEYRPRLFGRNHTVYGMRAKALVQKGFTEDQAKVLCGMIFNRIGRAGKH